ncbi:MAG TPA: signal peptidase I [Pseudonocardiaceae bacterium]
MAGDATGDRAGDAGRRRPGRFRRVVAGVALTTTLLLACLVVAALVLGVRVDGASMTPALRDGDRVLVNPLGDGPRRLDVVVARHTDGGPRVVKRVIALGGDQVRITGAVVEVRPGGVGEWRPVRNPAWTGRWSRPAAPLELTVPAGAVFLLGDNPDGSEDSRTLGPAPARLVQGTVVLRIWPPADAGRPQPLQQDG